MTNQIAMVLLFAAGFLFGGAATLLLRWRRHNSPEILESSKPIPYKPTGGPVHGAPVTREEMVDLAARFAAEVGALNDRIAALEAARAPGLPKGVRVLSLGGQYPRAVVAYDGKLWWKYSGHGWLNPTDGCAEDLLELPHWRELHGPEALAVHEDWKGRNEEGHAGRAGGQWVETGAGHFQRYKGGWRVHHAKCAITFREIREKTRDAQARGAETEDHQHPNG